MPSASTVMPPSDEAIGVPRLRFDARCDRQQLLPLHDEMAESDHRFADPSREPVERIRAGAARPNEQTRGKVRPIFEDEGPRHDRWCAGSGPPAEHEIPIALKLQDVEAIGRARHGGEERADRDRLQPGLDGIRARTAAVVDEVVAVPAAAAARAHLDQPRPDVLPRPSNRHSVRQRRDGVANQFVAGKHARVLEAVCSDTPEPAHAIFRGTSSASPPWLRGPGGETPGRLKFLAGHRNFPWHS
jgi:hypothetical protein